MTGVGGYVPGTTVSLLEYRRPVHRSLGDGGDDGGEDDSFGYELRPSFTRHSGAISRPCAGSRTGLPTEAFCDTRSPSEGYSGGGDL